MTKKRRPLPTPEGNCSCSWSITRGVPTMEARDAKCDWHGDGSLFWFRLEKRRERIRRAAANHPSAPRIR